jgi:hypothetical protein
MLTTDIGNKEASISQLKNDLSKHKKLLQEVEEKASNLIGFEAQQKANQAQIAQMTNEQSTLGLFAFAQKRELSAKIVSLTAVNTRLEKEIATAQAFIKTTGSAESLRHTVVTIEQKLGVKSSELAELNEKLVLLRAQIAPIVEQLENRQTIAILAQDEAILPLLIEEPSVAMIIKTDDELRYMIKSLEHFYVLPKSKQKTIFGSSTFDAEAVYYQACQAMEYAKSIDDIKWARGEFSAIKRYKNSLALLQKCDEMIARNTYKM